MYSGGIHNEARQNLNSPNRADLPVASPKLISLFDCTQLVRLGEMQGLNWQSIEALFRAQED